MENNIYFKIITSKFSKKHSSSKCSKCSSTNIKMTEFATRSADEATTIFIKCKDCNYTEVVSE